jgi:hypothetical protein
MTREERAARWWRKLEGDDWESQGSECFEKVNWQGELDDE